MTPQDYYDGDCELVRHYRRAFKMRQDRENQKLWLQGLYIYDAICRTAPILNPTSKKPEAIPYPEEPYPRTKEEQEERLLRKSREEYMRVKNAFREYAARTNEKFKEQSEVTGKDG